MFPKIKIKIESGFQKIGNFIYDHAAITLFLTTTLVGFLFCQVFFLEINTSSESLLHPQDPERIKYDDFREAFGRPELIIIMVESDPLFSKETLERLIRLHRDVENRVPYLKSVTSLANIETITFEKGRMATPLLLSGWPDVRIEKIKEKVLSSPLYQNYIVSEDSSATAVIIETLAKTGGRHDFVGEKENRQVVNALHNVMQHHHHPDFRLTLSGEPVIEAAFAAATMKDLKICITLSLITVMIFALILFQRLSGVFLSTLITISTLISTMGLMGVFNIPIKIVTIVVPAFIVAVSVAAAVHLLVIFFRRFQYSNDKKEAISFAMGHSGLAILMTSLTTAAGLLSFSFARLGAIEEIGYLSAVGVMLAFMFSIVMLPAIIAYLPLHSKKGEKASALMDHILARIAQFSCRHPKKIIGSCFILFLLSLYFLKTITFSHNLISFFPKNSVERQSITEIDQKMNGILSIELLVSPENGDAFQIETLNRIDAFCEEIKSLRIEGVSIGKVFAVTDIIKQVNQASNMDLSIFYLIPQNQTVISNGVRHLSGESKKRMADFISPNTGQVRISVKTTYADAMVYNRLIQAIEKKYAKIFINGDPLVVTGLVSLLARSIRAAIYSISDSYIAAFVAVSFMMILMLGSLKMGLISMIPNLLPIILIMGLMGFLNTPFNLNTLMIGSIAIGLVVDDTVHFMYNFQKFYATTRSVEQSVTATLLGTGRAMLITSLVLSSAFFMLMFASLGHVFRFGLFTGLTILVALLGDFFLAPALMKVFHRSAEDRS